ncbi:antibiotic biosynthesis monooxygenase family protein [Anaeromicrobium sediminis]|uniref:ABM domain-containing protein n=1 Tax=Anaeromicrobium sediminis TaxID=1478221 RepID=A0A267ML28_9FIRM|nr:antibiotic biosynthesis monooxygenase [Anaeromicrobium sediminis]PAB59480.1 hypothetical protein CCE28_09700 [Anaeromicrobium sediminis]
MNKGTITEIVEFNIMPGISDEEFIEIVNSLEEGFHKKQKGFIDTELVKGKDRQWIMIQHWESRDSVKESSRLLMREEITNDFRDMIDPKSVRMLILDKIKTWNK